MSETDTSLPQQALDAIRTGFPEQLRGTGEYAGQRWADVDRAQIVPILTMLRDTLDFDFLMDLTAVDWLGREEEAEERFCIVYVLYSLSNNDYFRVRAWVPEDDPRIDTLSSVWKAAPWAEREVWDMYGISFDGHADMKRILLPEDYPGHPLRKDYPLTGFGERHDFQRYSVQD